MKQAFLLSTLSCWAAIGSLYAQVEAVPRPVTDGVEEHIPMPADDAVQPYAAPANTPVTDPDKKDCFYYSDAPRTDVSWESPRLLDNLNNQGAAEAYPYLSEDGLRLYFTRQSEEGLNLYMASRKSIYDAFSNRQPLSPNLPDGAFSGWLSNDERELYYSDGQHLRYAYRNGLGEDFSASATITLLGMDLDFISGPSLTPDKQELYIYHNDTEKQILRFRKTGVMEYTLLEQLAMPPGLRPGPGQLSKNGLSYYFSLEAQGQDRLFKYSRASLDGPWYKLEALDGIFCDTDISPAQPSVSLDEQIVACTSTAEDSWDNNDLSVSTAIPQSTAGTSTPGPTGVELAMEEPPVSYALGTRVYPNPTDVRVTLAIDRVDADASFTLYDINGRELQRQTIRNTQTGIDLENLPGGIYFLKVVQANTVELVKVIKR